jgi:hypothetical protein
MARNIKIPEYRSPDDGELRNRFDVDGILRRAVHESLLRCAEEVLAISPLSGFDLNSCPMASPSMSSSIGSTPIRSHSGGTGCRVGTRSKKYTPYKVKAKRAGLGWPKGALAHPGPHLRKSVLLHRLHLGSSDGLRVLQPRPQEPRQGLEEVPQALQDGRQVSLRHVGEERWHEEPLRSGRRQKVGGPALMATF